MDRTTQSLLKEDRVHGDSMFPLAAYWIELPAGTHVLIPIGMKKRSFLCCWKEKFCFR